MPVHDDLGCGSVDLVPDFIPVVGYLYDFLILPALAGLAIKLYQRK